MNPLVLAARLSRRHEEEGQVLVLMAFAMIVFVAMAGLVLDIAALRQDRRTDTTAADLAAVSAADALDPYAGGSPYLACQDAWTYIQEDLPDLPSGSAFPCSSFRADSASSVYSCLPAAVGNQQPTAALPVSASFPSSSPQYTITMETPVPDADALMTDPNGEPVQASHDGNECQRFGITIVKHQPYLFGPAVGVKNGTTTERAVARYTVTPGETYPTLAALDPHACPAISAGNGFIEAYAAIDAKGNLVSPGLAYADSDGQGYSGSGACNSSSKVVLQVNGQGGSAANCWPGPPPGGQGYICAQNAADPVQPGVIGTYAFAVTPSEAYRPGFNYFPSPTELPAPITTEPIDLLYHCTNSTVPTGTSCPVDAINTLNSTYSGLVYQSAANNNLPANWNVVSTCSVSGALVITPPAYVNCPDSGKGFTVKGGTVEISGGSAGGPVVFAGSINFSSQGGNFWVLDTVDVNGSGQNPSPGDTNLADYSSSTGSSLLPDTLVYLQNSGSISLSSGSSMVLPHTFVYTGSGSGGCLNIGSGASLSWSAAAGNTTASALYHKLMFWSYGTCGATAGQAPPGGNANSVMDGGASFSMDGILFSPDANWTITGSGTVDARNVQFWVNTIGISSTNAGLFLRADPNNAVTLSGGVDLIR